ncbi:MAG: hypothetical protein LUC50_08675 [Ruminococcus sp.]|nr:hypothetical protein [Ruminococcus sp.]
MKLALSSFPLVISGEAIANAGEDAYVARVLQNGSCYFGVFDGCGA